MTNHTPIEVTQGDRDAAARYYAAFACGRGKDIELKALIENEADGYVDPLVCVLARHRIESQAGLVEALEAIEEHETGRACMNAAEANEWTLIDVREIARAAIAKAKGEA